MAGRILIVDDDAAFSKALSRGLTGGGHDVTACGTSAEAHQLLASGEVDVVVLDYQLPDADGLALLDELHAGATGPVYLMATAYPDLNVAVEAMRRGAFDYIAKDNELRECLMRIERAIEVSTLRRRVAEASRSTSDLALEQGLLGQSPAMRALQARLSALSASDETTAFIVGETGTGKGVVARLIHAASGRAYEPFVAVDCTTIPVTLVESELFGHERGAFSGAVATKLGRVEVAGRGTLFLDEIAELDLGTQSKLLRLLEEREYTRVGSTRARVLQARIIAATNRDLGRAVADGRFRPDLRYRLEVFVVEVPPLRQRGDDVFLLAAHFAAERARALGRPPPRLHPDIVRMLPKYPYPGNVRELRNMVDQAVLLGQSDELTLEEFPVLKRLESGWVPGFTNPPPSAASPQASVSDSPPRPSLALRREDRSHDMATAHSQKVASLADIRQGHAGREKESLAEALHATRGNVTAAARNVGLSRYQFLRRLAKYGMR